MAAPDLGTIHALCLLQLATRRLGCTIRLFDPPPELRELIVLVGLEGVLLEATASGRVSDHHDDD
jgi:anti-anti-sigma regulatory factor